MTTRTREETAVEFASVVTLPPGVRVPEADAPLHEHLAWVGHVAEALAPTWNLYDINNVWRFRDPKPLEWRVAFWNDDAVVQCRRGSAPDLSHAAMLAAIPAKRGAL